MLHNCDIKVFIFIKSNRWLTKLMINLFVYYKIFKNNKYVWISLKFIFDIQQVVCIVKTYTIECYFKVILMLHHSLLYFNY